MTAQDYRISINDLLSEVHDDTVLEACYEILKNVVKIKDTRILGERESKHESLRKAIKEGEESGFVENFDPDVLLASLHEKHGIK